MLKKLFIAVLFFLLPICFAAAQVPQLDPQIEEENDYQVLLAEYVPQPTPEQSFDLEIEMMKQEMYCFDLPLFDAEWRKQGKEIQHNKVFKETADQINSTYKVKIEGKHAVLYFPEQQNLAPVFLFQDDQGWVIDRGISSKKLFMNPPGASWAVMEGDDPYFKIIKEIFPLREIATDENTKARIFEINNVLQSPEQKEDAAGTKENHG